MDILGLPRPGGPPPKTRTTLIMFAVLVLLALGLSLTEPSRPGPEDVRAADAELRHAMVDADMKVLERALAPDLALVVPPGHRTSRADYLAAVGSGDVDYRAFDPAGDIATRFGGDLAVLTYAAHVDVATGRDHVAHTAWVTHVFERRAGRWLLVSGQSIGIGDSPPVGER